MDLFLKKLDEYYRLGFIEEKYSAILKDFYLSYKNETKAANASDIFCTLLDLIKKEKHSPHKFQPYHKKITHPFNHYLFGIDFIKPLIEKGSRVEGEENLKVIEEILKQKENVILLANHQTESDPQIISSLLDKHFKDLASKIIYVAGERVITDPLAVPFSLGCDLLCIYSKKYIDNPPSQKMQKQLHNKKTMELMSLLLSEGGKIIYVAPSGGRDRAKDGKIEVAPFDGNSLEMFRLMASKSSCKTHFFPLALLSFHLLPPPETVQIEMGEKRQVKKATVHAYFGSEIDMDSLPESKDKLLKRKIRAEYIHDIVENLYEKLRSI